ncbi:AraC family transcriptional regulator [Ruminococcus sp.]|uniref:helix-turn-helix domain-containing protein n=1 Tax=Ruminococcus sp. TaxID=41978 RepID=UPI0025FB56B5|nr:AraC family transcriptional regulator [Ruminococcus sp.]MBQ8966733.1 helix-turn-helix transcriptional regulator [Ruminococcus sp.]
MNDDLFERLDSAGFGSNVHQIAAEGECRVLRLDDETGEAFMTMYQVFEGVYLMYNDFHLSRCVSEYQNADTVLCIDHCREGRIEHENGIGGRYYMEAGDLRLDRRVHHDGMVELPLSHYHGMTIGFMEGTAAESLKRGFPWADIDLERISEKFSLNDREFLIRADEGFGRVFSQLYHAPKAVRKDYFKLKICELLLLLEAADPERYSEQHRYFPARQTDRIKEIHDLVTTELERSFTVEELSERFGLPPATLRKVFKAVYVSPIYQYCKSYKMKAAASMLISEKDMTIARIAQRLGYDNASKFSAAFRDVMGVTPQNYRSRQEEQ